MKTSEKHATILAKLALVLALTLVIYFLIGVNSFDGTWGHTYFPGSILLFCAIGLIGFFKERKNKKLNRLMGRLFIKSKIDWAEEYEKHLKGSNANISFSPTSGISICECKYCFFRTGPKNPQNDCQIADKSAKKFFRWSQNKILPEVIDDKEVGNYCPYWTDMNAE